MADNFYLYDLRNSLPYFMKSEEGMELLMDIMNVKINDVKPLIDNMPDLMDYDTVRTDFLPLLASLLSYEYRYTDDKLYQADLIRQLLQSFSMKGNNDDIVTTVESFDNPGWLAGDYFYPRYWREHKGTSIEHNIDKVFTHNVSKHSNGHRFQDGIQWLAGVITINSTDYLTDELKDYLDKVVPAGIKYIIVPFTDIVGPNRELLYLGAYLNSNIVNQYTKYDIVVDRLDIPKLIEYNGMGLTLIHSDKHTNFRNFYNPDTHPVYVGTYTTYQEDNPTDPYLYEWEIFNGQVIPEEAYSGKGKPIDLGARTAYIHYAFSDYVTGRLHSGGYITADNHTDVNIYLADSFNKYLKVHDPYVTINSHIQNFNLPPILVSDSIDVINSLPYYRFMGRYASNFKSNESIKHLADSLPAMSNVMGIDGFEISSDGANLHIAYADNALGTIDFSLTDDTKRYIGKYSDNKTTQSNDPQRYAWTLNQ